MSESLLPTINVERHFHIGHISREQAANLAAGKAKGRICLPRLSLSSSSSWMSSSSSWISLASSSSSPLLLSLFLGVGIIDGFLFLAGLPLAFGAVTEDEEEEDEDSEELSVISFLFLLRLLNFESEAGEGSCWFRDRLDEVAGNDWFSWFSSCCCCCWDWKKIKVKPNIVNLVGLLYNIGKIF